MTYCFRYFNELTLQEWTIDMTGQMNPGHRSVNWQVKRVFFVTPQVFEKDIESGFPLSSAFKYNPFTYSQYIHLCIYLTYINIKLIEDIFGNSGSCPMKDVVCLVVDEAHRAMGNYSYCVVVRKVKYFDYVHKFFFFNLLG
jgi:Fanconi anemia group M protein